MCLNLHQVSTLALFKGIMDHKQHLPRDQPYKDLVKLIQFLLRQFFKAAEEDPFIVVHVRTFHPLSCCRLIVSDNSGAIPEESWSLETILELETRREIH